MKKMTITDAETGETILETQAGSCTPFINLNKDSEKFGSLITGYVGTVYSVTHLVEKSTIVFDGGFELEVQPIQTWIYPGIRIEVDYIDMSITYIENKPAQ